MKAARIIFLVFVGVGSTFLVVAALHFIQTRQFTQTAAKTDGVVVANVWSHGSSRNSSTSYHPRVRFRAGDGREILFVSTVGTSPPSYRVGEHVEVLYDPADLAHASINGFWSLWFLSVIFGGLGALFCAGGLVPFAVLRRIRQRDDWLRSNGVRIRADVDRVELNSSLQVNGKSPYRIVCQWLDPATNQIHVFRSHNFWYDPEKYIPGKTMDVLVDPNNFKRYVLDTEFLPKLAD